MRITKGAAGGVICGLAMWALLSGFDSGDSAKKASGLESPTVCLLYTSDAADE